MPAPRQVNRFIAAQPVAFPVRWLPRHQPLRITAAVPLRADIWTGPHDYVKAEVLRHLQPILKIGEVHLGKISRPRRHLPLVPVPRHIRLHRVESRVLDLLKSIPPKRFRASEIMKTPAVNENILAFDGQAVPVITNSVRMRKRSRLRAESHSGSRYQQAGD